jgi:hypothetical protein
LLNVFVKENFKKYLINVRMGRNHSMTHGYGDPFLHRMMNLVECFFYPSSKAKIPPKKELFFSVEFGHFLIPNVCEKKYCAASKKKTMQIKKQISFFFKLFFLNEKQQ